MTKSISEKLKKVLSSVVEDSTKIQSLDESSDFISELNMSSIDSLQLLSLVETEFKFNYEAQNWEDMISREFTNVVEYVNTNLSKSIALNDLYAKFYINKTKLELMFHRYYNMPFRQYTRNHRLEIAKDSLSLYRHSQFYLSHVSTSM